MFRKRRVWLLSGSWKHETPTSKNKMIAKEGTTLEVTANSSCITDGVSIKQRTCPEVSSRSERRLTNSKALSSTRVSYLAGAHQHPRPLLKSVLLTGLGWVSDQQVVGQSSG